LNSPISSDPKPIKKAAAAKSGNPLTNLYEKEPKSKKGLLIACNRPSNRKNKSDNSGNTQADNPHHMKGITWDFGEFPKASGFGSE